MAHTLLEQVYWGAGIVTAAAAVILLVFVLLQTKTALGAIRAQAWHEAQRLYTEKLFVRAGENGDEKSISFLEFRRRIISLEREIPTGAWDSRDDFQRLGVTNAPKDDAGLRRLKNDALDVCRGMDVIGQLVLAKGLTMKTVLNAWGDPFRKTWIVLGPLVKKEQEFRGDGVPFWKGFEKVGKKAVKRFRYPTRWEVQNRRTKMPGTSVQGGQAPTPSR